MISQSFSTKLNDISQDLGMNPRDLLLVIYLESGANPAAKNPSGATGLIQFMPSTLKGMGLSSQEIKTFGQKTAEDQLNYVKQYVKSHMGLVGGKPFTSATQYYVANFFPIALKKWNGDDPEKNANVVVVDGNSPNPNERAAYKQNTILDANKDNKITVGDITTVLMRMEGSSGFQKMLSQFNTVAGNGDVSEKSKFNSHQAPKEEIANIPTQLMDRVNKFLDSFGNNIPNTYLISISSDSDFISKLEYARVLSSALKEELGAKSDIFTDEKNIQVQCSLNENCKPAIKELCSAVSDVFSDATKKIGSIKINTKITQNILPSYQELDIKLAEINYRKFHLKFAIGK
jgi:hypothetical protein